MSKPSLFVVLVCGGRNHRDQGAVWSALDELDARRPITRLIEGGATGVDELAYAWGRKRLVPIESHKAEWDVHGRAAGPIRNAKMLADGNPDLVIAFPGGPGTANMVKLAKQHGVEVWEPLSGSTQEGDRTAPRDAK